MRSPGVRFGGHDRRIDHHLLDPEAALQHYLQGARDAILDARHAGHADILREGIDGVAGMAVASTNMPDVDWSAYVRRLTDVATASGRAERAGPILHW